MPKDAEENAKILKCIRGHIPYHAKQMLVGINLLLSVCRLGSTRYEFFHLIERRKVGRVELDPVAGNESWFFFFHGGDEPNYLTCVVFHGFLDRCGKQKTE